MRSWPSLPKTSCSATGWASPTCVLRTILICVNHNFTLLQTVAFSLGSGLRYLFAVAVVDEGRRRLRSKDVPAIFTGMPISLIYIGILALAIYGLVGHSIV